MLRVIRQRDFALLWFAGLISMTGDWMLIVALPAAVYQLTDSAVATSGVLIAHRIPALFLGSVAGVFVDRWDRRRTMVIVNVLRAPMLLLLMAVDSADRVWVVYLVTFAVSALTQFFGPAENALLPRLVNKDHLIPANALNALNNNLTRLIGPALGGVVAGLYGLDGVAVADAASFLLAGGLIAAIATTSAPTRERAVGVGAWQALWQEWLAGVRMVIGSRVLLVVFGVMAISSLGEGVMGAAFWVWVDEALDGGTLEAGRLMSAQAVGGLIGSLLMGSWPRRMSPVGLLGWGAIGLGVTDLMLFNYPAVISGIWFGLVLLCLAGFPVTAFGTGYTTTIQTEADDAYRGRVFGAVNTTMGLLMIVGAGIARPATERLAAVTVLSIQAVAYPVAGVFALTMMGEWTLGRSRHGGEEQPRRAEQRQTEV